MNWLSSNRGKLRLSGKMAGADLTDEAEQAEKVIALAAIVIKTAALRVARI
jgi:hypothetical protein